MTQETNPLFSRSRPYYVVAEDYSRLSSVSRVMHLLCHALNQSGFEAYLLSGHTATSLRTPPLTDEIETRHKNAGITPIIIYPESLPDNPLRADCAIRYFNGGDFHLDAGEYPLTTSAQAKTSLGKLPIPLTDPATYRPFDTPRHRRLAHTGNYPDAALHFAELLQSCELIDEHHPASEEALLTILRQGERLYCFGESSLALEASLCGCPVIYIAAPGGPTSPSAFLNEVPDAFTTDDSDGALTRVRAALPLVHARYTDIVRGFNATLQDFVARTQTIRPAPKAPLIHEEVSQSLTARWIALRSTRPTIDQRRYLQWRSSRSIPEIEGQLMAERMLGQWKHRPRFHILTELRSGEESLLADTVDSLSAQLYQDWRLTVVTELPEPSEWLTTQPRISWISLAGRRTAQEILQQCALSTHGDWLSLLEPGTRLEPFALQTIGDYANARQDWDFIYSDDDDVDGRGRLANPRFKPDFNLDLLRSINYLGSFCLIRTTTLRKLGGLGAHDGAELYDLALRVLDHSGAPAIGHIAQILHHSPSPSRRDICVAAERAALQDHLCRVGANASIQDGHGFATRHVIYQHEQPARVAIIIATRDKAEYFGQCMESILNRTHYPNWELIVLDSGNVSPDSVSILDKLRITHTVATSIVSVHPDSSIAEQYNAGAASSDADYVLFLDDDCIVLQEDWLTRLMANAQRPEVGMVGPRFAAPGQERLHDLAHILGLHGIAAPPYNGHLGMESPGYQGFKLLDQCVSALSPACMLVRHTLFKELGGFNSSDYARAHYALDLSLRISKARYWIVWTPYVTLAHYAAGTRVTTLPQQQTTPEHTTTETERLLEQWLGALARDPFYNPNLSLGEAYQPDHRATVNWDPQFHDRDRLLGFPLHGGSGEYRMIAPFRAIARAGLAQTSIILPQQRKMRVLSAVELARAAPDVVIVHQAVERWQIEALKTYRKHLPGIRRITGLDDLISLLPPKHPRYYKRAIDMMPRLRASLAECDRVVVSTEPLAELCRPLIDDVVVMPNCLEWDIWGKLDSTYAPGQRPRVGWIGAQQHYGDLEHIFEVVETLADEVDWVFMGMCPAPIRPYVKEFHEWAHGFEAYAAKMATLNLDLALAPLDVNPFNEAKSNLRLLEYGAMRWPVVCTDIYPYQGAPVTRVPNKASAWIGAIREKLSDRAAARREGEALRTWVEAQFILEKRVGDWLKAFRPN